jgi:hypothetical protein
MSLWLVAPITLITIGTVVLANQTCAACMALNVFSPDMFDVVPSDSSTQTAMAESLRTLLVRDAALPAIFEEAINRGLVLTALAAFMSKRRAIVISAIYFSLWHFSFVRTPHTLLLGLVYGWLFVRTGSLLPGMLAHALHNGIITLGLDTGITVDRYGLYPAWVGWTGAAMIVVGIAGVRLTRARPAAEWFDPPDEREAAEQVAA